jgi:hypothetical protein
MILDVTKKPYYARGDGKTDDTDNIQKALNDAVYAWDKTLNQPQHWTIITSETVPLGKVVYLPGDRVYKISRPLQVWGMTIVCGDGTNTMIDARSIPQDKSAFELAGVKIGDDSWNSGVQIKDIALMSGGHGITSNASQTLNTFLQNLQLCTKGWGINFANQYSQGLNIDNIIHSNPCSGGLVIKGNLNYIKSYQMIRGYGGWDGTQGFISPWHNGGFGQIDVRGSGNTVINCHVEHNTPNTPDTSIIPFVIKGDWAHLVNNWPEFHQENELFDGVVMLIENCYPTGQWWSNGKVRLINAGRVFIPQLDSNFAGRISSLIDAQGDTEVTVGLHIGYWGTDLPSNVKIEKARQTNIFLDKTSKTYDPNPRGDNLIKNPQWYLAIGQGGEATMEVSPDGYSVTIDVTKRPDSGGISANFNVPTGSDKYQWVLYSADMECDKEAAAWPYWWCSDPNFILTNTNRTYNGSCSSPLPKWEAGACLSLAANGLGKHTFKNIKVTKLEE